LPKNTFEINEQRTVTYGKGKPYETASGSGGLWNMSTALSYSKKFLIFG